MLVTLEIRGRQKLGSQNPDRKKRPSSLYLLRTSIYLFLAALKLMDNIQTRNYRRHHYTQKYSVYNLHPSHLSLLSKSEHPCNFYTSSPPTQLP